MFWESLGPLLPFLIVAFDLSHTQAGRLGFVSSLVYGLLNYPSGHLSDKYGKRLLILLFLLISSGATLLMVFSTSYLQLFFLFAIAGFGGGLYHPPGTALLSNSFPRKTRGRALGFHASGGALGILLGFAVVGGVATYWNWKISLACLSGVGFALAVAFRALLWDVEDHGDEASAPDFPSGANPTLDLWTLFKWVPRMLVLYGIVMFVFKGSYIWVPTYLKEVYHLSMGKAILFSVILPTIGIFSNYSMGKFSDEFGRRFSLVLIFSVLALCFLLLYLGIHFILIPLLFVFGFFINSFSGVINAYTRDLLPPEAMGKAFGLIFTVSICTSAFSPYVMGIISDRSSLSMSMLFLGAVSLTGAFISLKRPKLLRGDFRQKRLNQKEPLC
jgi:MFS family permease